MIPFPANFCVRRGERPTDPAVRRKCGTFGGAVGIVCNCLLFAAKLAFGIACGAISLLADAFNNLGDVGTSSVTLFGFKLAGKPADKEHPFGHGRAEYIAGLVVAIAIIVMGLELVISSIEQLIRPTPTLFSLPAVIVLAVCVALKCWLGAFDLLLGRAIGSDVLRTAARDSFCDCAATVAVLVGLVVGFSTGVDIDAWLGAAVGAFVLLGGIFAARDAFGPLLGGKPSREAIAGIRSEVLSHPEIIGIHDLIVHDYGPGRKLVTLHVEVAADTDLSAVHEEVDGIERDLRARYGYETTIHVDPVDLSDALTTELRAHFGKKAAELGEGIRIHDFRTVHGAAHVRILFDCVVPFGFRMSDADIRAYFAKAASGLDPSYFVVVNVEHALEED